MLDRRFFAEAAALVALAVVCAVVANLVAARERKLAWAGDYPNARVVPQPIAGERAAALTPVILDREPDLTPEEAPVAAAEPPAATPAAAASAAAARPKAPTERQSASPPELTLADFPPAPDRPAADVTPQQAEALWRLKAPFLDARRTDVYRQGHIAGARSFPVWESDIDARVVAFYEEGHPGDAPIVVYCSGGACEDSHMLAQKLWGVGFNNVLVYTDGWPDWVGRGLPTRTGEQP